MNANHRRAVRDFVSYLRELRDGCNEERRKAIKREAIVCEDLMNYSSDVCRDFTLLNGLVQATFRALAKKS